MASFARLCHEIKHQLTQQLSPALLTGNCGTATCFVSRPLVSAVTNWWRPGANQQEMSYYNYTPDNRGQRTAAAVEGEAVGGSGFSWTWGYDSRGELTSADRSGGSTNDQQYTYDPIGNRVSSKNGDDPWFYYGCRNALNQYTVFAYWDNSCSPDMAWGTPAYDADGNLTNDGGIQHPLGLYYGTPYTYAYDGENRLVEARPTTLTVGCTKVSYTYDYRNRRVRRQASTCTNALGSGTWSAASDTRYVWDGWLLLAELNGASSNALLRSYTWGLDLAGQWAGRVGRGGARSALERAGGSGGLLAVREGNASSTTNYVYTFDGNGNVSEVLDLSVYPYSGSVMVAKYQYAPYGNVLSEAGSCAAVNRWRFSTKQFDSETGLGYWGERWYAPVLGRWINRDPIQERGGANVYFYARNNSVSGRDAFGNCGSGRTPMGYIGPFDPQPGPALPPAWWIPPGAPAPYVPAPPPTAPPPSNSPPRYFPAVPPPAPGILPMPEPPRWHRPPSAPGPTIPDCPEREPPQVGDAAMHDGWCQDTDFPHCPDQNLRCYRSYGTGTVGGQQCCYDPNGMLNHNPECMGSIDEVGPAKGEDERTGLCVWSWGNVIGHGIEDVLPAHLGYEVELQCCLRFYDIPSGSGGHGVSDEELAGWVEECLKLIIVDEQHFCDKPGGDGLAASLKTSQGLCPARR